ncbi:MAG TPA: hypothetical protein VEY70_06065 [Metabacillus sp.]|nr:hypothetical protein [Metabacillus sp.]
MAYRENYFERVESGIDTNRYFNKEIMVKIEFGFNKGKVVGVLLRKLDGKNR